MLHYKRLNGKGRKKMDIQKLSEETGCNLQAALGRLNGMEALYGRLLKKFIDDPTFQELKEAVKAEDLKAIETKAHTLKGTAANLGLDSLSEKSHEIVCAVREGRPEDTKALFTECEAGYERILAALRRME